MVQNINKNGEFGVHKRLQLVFQQCDYVLHAQYINRTLKEYNFTLAFKDFYLKNQFRRLTIGTLSASEMTYIVSSGALNSTHSPVHNHNFSGIRISK